MMLRHPEVTHARVGNLHRNEYFSSTGWVSGMVCARGIALKYTSASEKRNGVIFRR